jgi:hypothetical protein
MITVGAPRVILYCIVYEPSADHAFTVVAEYDFPALRIHLVRLFFFSLHVRCFSYSGQYCQPVEIFAAKRKSGSKEISAPNCMQISK